MTEYRPEWERDFSELIDQKLTAITIDCSRRVIFVTDYNKIYTLCAKEYETFAPEKIDRINGDICSIIGSRIIEANKKVHSNDNGAKFIFNIFTHKNNVSFIWDLESEMYHDPDVIFEDMYLLPRVGDSDEPKPYILAYAK